MDIRGKNVLVLGGYGLVGMAVCREILRDEPRRLVVGSLRRSEAEEAVGILRREHPQARAEILPAWGDLLLRAEWQSAPEGVHPRTSVLADVNRRRRLVADILDELDPEILGPPRLSKLLFEAYLLKRSCGRIPDVLNHTPDELAEMLLKDLTENAGLRQQILSIGIPILLPDGAQMMRGPVIKSTDSEHGWVDLTPANMSRWQERATALQAAIQASHGSDTSSRFDRSYRSMRTWSEEDDFDVGEFAGWLFDYEEQGRRGKD